METSRLRSDLDQNFVLFDNFHIWKNLENFDPNLKIFIGKNIFSSNFLVFLKRSPISSIDTKYEGITPKTPKVMLIFR